MTVPTRQYMEDALDEVKDYLDENFKRILTTVRTARKDKTTPNPGEISRGKSHINKFPKIELLPERTLHEYGDESAPLTTPWLVHGIVLSIVHQSSNVEVVEETLLRYSETINKLQEEDDTFGSVFSWITLGEEDYSPMMESQEERKAMQVVLIPLLCRTL